MEKVRARLLIRGFVQGVFFRASTRDEAQRLGVSGWVRNRRDGDVEALVEGDRGSVERLIEWCRVGGPPTARVTGVEVKWEPYAGEFDHFKVTY
ncbi:MAG: acylphosphatase [Deltaproteobacteria bacterium]|nr:acylphosphatase [Deltaproteobacteria bacterium]